MRRKGLVYRATTLLGLSIIFLQFGGEIFYAKYFRSERDEILEKVTELNVINNILLSRARKKKRGKVSSKKKMTPQMLKFKRN